MWGGEDWKLLNTHLTLFRQANESVQQEPQLALKIAPLPLIDVFGSNIAILSLEKELKNNTSISLEMRGLYHSIGYGLQNNRGWIGGIEWRQYWKEKEGKYWAVCFRHRSQE